MILESQRTQVADYGRKLIAAGLTSGTGGNLSVYDRQAGLVAVSPSGMEYDAIRSEDVTVLNLDGTVADGQRKPSSEAPMHLLFYKTRPDRNAVVHTHSPAITTLACLRLPLPPVSYLVALSGRDEIPCAPYRDFGGSELAQAAVEAADGCDAVILANHGLVALGKDMTAAFQLAQELEFCADIYLRCLAAGREPVLLSAEEMARARKRFGTYGQGETNADHTKRNTAL